MAEYYDMLAEYYDTCLDGQYATDDKEKKLKQLLKAIDQSVFHMNLAKGGYKKVQLIKYTLNKENVLIRSTQEKAGEIKKILARAGKW